MKDLAQLCSQLAPSSGAWPTALDSLQILRADAIQPRVHSLQHPAICFLVQGAKVVSIGRTTFRYSAHEFLFLSVELPVVGAIVDATPDEPYLCLKLAVEPATVLELVASSQSNGVSTDDKARRAIHVGKENALISDAFFRLASCLDNPSDAQVLAPSIVREITYRLLCSPYGDAVRDLGIPGSQTQRIARAIKRLKQDFSKVLSIEELAGVAAMSESSFYAHFRKVTTLSPLQYQKRLQLHEARRLLLMPGASASDVAFRVGYESPSQFSREYRRLFGLPPMSDAKQAMRQV